MNDLAKLIEDLLDPDPRVNRKAAVAMGKLKGEQSFADLVAALEDERQRVRAAAAWALGIRGDPRALEPLMAVVGRVAEDPKTFTSAMDALEELNNKGVVPFETLIEVLSEGRDTHLRTWAAHALGRRGDSRAVEPLIAAAQGGDSDVLGAATSALKDLSYARAVETEQLITALNEGGNVQVRQLLASVLGGRGDARGVEPLMAAALDEDGVLRRIAVEALRRMDEAGVVETGQLIALLDQSDDALVRDWAAGALEKRVDARATKVLMEAVFDAEPGVTDSARWGLEKLNREGIVEIEPLLDILAEGWPSEYEGGIRELRFWALGMLAMSGDPRAVEPLIAALQVGAIPSENFRARMASKEVRLLAVEALKDLGDPRALAALAATFANKQEWGDIREEAAGALGNLGSIAAAPLIAFVEDESESPDYRALAADELGRIGGPEVVESLIGVLANAGERRELLKRVALALERIGGPEAEQALTEFRSSF